MTGETSPGPSGTLSTMWRGGRWRMALWSGFGICFVILASGEAVDVEAGEGSGCAVAAGLEGFELVQGAVERAVEVGFVADDVLERGGTSPVGTAPRWSILLVRQHGAMTACTGSTP